MSLLSSQGWEPLEVIGVDGSDGRSEVAGQLDGIRLATGEVILLTNSDIFVQADWVARHMRHYPGADFVMGRSPHLPMRTLLSLSFTNFSAKKEVLQRVPIRETLHQDLDFSMRLRKTKYRGVMDNSIHVETDDQGIRGRKAMVYLRNIVVLYRKNKIPPVPPWVPWAGIRDAIDRPEKLLGIVMGIMAPVDHTFGKRVSK